MIATWMNFGHVYDGTSKSRSASCLCTRRSSSFCQHSSRPFTSPRGCDSWIVDARVYLQHVCTLYFLVTRLRFFISSLIAIIFAPITADVLSLTFIVRCFRQTAGVFLIFFYRTFVDIKLTALAEYFVQSWNLKCFSSMSWSPDSI